MSEPETEPETAKPVLEIFRGSSEELDRRLRAAAEELQLAIPEEAWPGIQRYCEALWGWNTRVNLTRHTTPELFVKRDLLDSWHVSQLLDPKEEILDVGTGSGVPGILVAILRPDVQVTLCDSVAKKAKVVDEIVLKLGLKVPVYPQSVQSLLEEFRYDTLTSRAVGPLVKLCRWLEPYWHTFGRMLAIKGPKWPDERGEARHRGLLKKVELRKLVSYPMPDTHSESTILQLKRIG